MEKETKTSTGETPAETEMVQEVAKPEETVEEVVEELDKKDPKITFDKIRAERDEEKKSRKAAQDEVNRLKEALRAKEEKEAEEAGNYKKLWEAKLEELTTEKENIKSLNEKYEAEKALNKKALKEVNEALNKMIDDGIKDWPDEAKELVDQATETSAAARLNQYRKAFPLVNKLKTNKTPTSPGITPSPRDVRESGDKDREENPQDLVAVFKRTGMYNF